MIPYDRIISAWVHVAKNTSRHRPQIDSLIPGIRLSF